MVVGDRVVVGDIKERQQARAIYEQAQAERPEGGADRTGAAEHLHQLGRQYRPRRNRAGADRISGAGAAIRRATFSLRVPMVVGAALQSRADRAERRLPPGRRRLGRDQIRSGAGPRPHLAARCSIPRRTRRSIRPASPCACRPASRSARSRAIITAVKIESPDDDHAHPHACRRRGAGRPRFRTDLEAGRRRRRRRSACSASVSATPTTCSPSSRRPSVEQAHAEAAAARSDLRDRQFRLDGRHLDRRRPRPASLTRLGRLQPGDRFNVIRFDDTMDVLFPAPVPADREHVGRATSLSTRCRPRRHRDGAGDARGADRQARRHQLCPAGRVPDRRRDRQRAAIVRDHHRACAAARASSWSASGRRRTPI